MQNTIISFKVSPADTSRESFVEKSRASSKGVLPYAIFGYSCLESSFLAGAFAVLAFVLWHVLALPWDSDPRLVLRLNQVPLSFFALFRLTATVHLILTFCIFVTIARSRTERRAPRLLPGDRLLLPVMQLIQRRPNGPGQVKP